MIIKTLKKYFLRNLFFYSALVLVLDQISKYLILKNFKIYESFEVTSFLNIVLVFNTGAAFSIFADGHDWQRYMLIVSSITIIFFLLYFLKRHAENNKLQQLAIYLIIAGAIGNLIDRIQLGMVVDFIDFHFLNIHWPAFNIADSAISLGAITLLVVEFKSQATNKKKSKEN